MAILDRLDLDKQKIISILIAGLVIAAIDVLVIMKMQINTVKSASKRETTMAGGLKSAQKELLDLKKEATGEKRQKVKTVLSENEMPALMQDIDGLAKKYNIRVIQIKPSSLAVSKGQVKAPKSDIGPVFLALEVDSSYHQFGRFINSIENMEKFVIVEEMKIIPLAGQHSQQRVNLTLKAYVKK